MCVSKMKMVFASVLLFGCDTDMPASRECQYDTDCARQSFCREGSCLGDDVVPILSLTSPEAAQVFSTATFTLEGRVSDGDGAGIAKCEYSLDGSNWVDLPVSEDRFSAEVALPGTDRVELELLVRATDRAGNQTTLTRDLAADRAGPTIRLDSPSRTVFNLSDLGTSVEASLLVSDRSTLASVEYSLDAGLTWTATESTSAFVVPLFQVLPGEPGAVHSLAVRAADSVGNVSAAVFELFVDTVSPALQISLEGLALLGKAAPNPYAVSGTITEQTLETLLFQLDSAPEAALESDAAGGFGLNLALDESEDHVLHTLALKAIDTAGNSTRVERSFYVDRVAPALAVFAPSADGMCDALGCTGAVVNLGSPTSMRFEGLVSDGAGISTGRLVARLDGRPFACALEVGSWSCQWPDVPAEGGVMHLFAIEASDLAGNVTGAARSVFVDRIAPTVAVPHDRQRVVSSSADLVVFSEEMRRATVQHAVTLNGVGAGADLASADGRTFFFLNGTGLAPYTIFEMEVGVAATDLAGNPLAAPVTARFMTEPLLPDEASFSTVDPTSPARGPLFATDQDGKPALLWWHPPTHTLRWAAWNGRDNWTTKSFGSLADATDVRPGSFVADSYIHSSFDLEVGFRATVAAQNSSGAAAYFGKMIAMDPEGLTLAHGIAPLSTPALGTARPSYVAGSDTVGGDLLAYVDPSGQHLQVLRPLSSGWMAPVTVLSPATGIAGLHGTALLDNSRPAKLFHAPNAWDTGVTIPDNAEAFHGIDRVVVDGLPIGSLWSVVSTNDRLHSCKLVLACAPTATGRWVSSVVPGPCPLKGHVTGVVLSASKTDVGIAVELRDTQGNMSVGFGSFPNDCAALPSAVTFDFVPNATQPAVAVGRNKALFRAYVDSSDTLVFDL